MVARRYLLQQMSVIAGAGMLLPIHTVLQASQVSIDAIASGGGSIHCATQQQPLVK